MITEITCEDLKARLDRGEKVNILDVRNPNETAHCKLATSITIPLGELPARLAELNPQEEWVVHCKMGGRSARACQLLHEAGFAQPVNLAGGINAWVERIDPAMPKPI